MNSVSDDIDGYSAINNRPYYYVPKLSSGAKNLWAYLMHLPDSCKISIDHLYRFYDPQISCRVNGEKKYIEKSLNELIRHDYLKEERICD
jgi:hypothetical protein